MGRCGSTFVELVLSWQLLGPPLCGSIYDRGLFPQAQYSRPCLKVFKVVPRGRLESRTLRLLAVRSNQLSYETSWLSFLFVP